MKKKVIHVNYHALLREERGTSKESLETMAQTALELYHELKKEYNFTISITSLRIAINDEFCDWKTKLNSHDTLVFIPPVSGG